MSETKPKPKGPNERPISDNLVETAVAVGNDDYETAEEHLRCALAKVRRRRGETDE